MKETTGNDFTTGDVKKHILKFAIPMLIGLFLTQGYTIINTIMEIRGLWYAMLITYAFTSTCSMLYYLSVKYKEKLSEYGEKVYS